MANPLVIGALLVAGAGTIYLLSKKPAPKKKKKKKAPTAKPTEPTPTAKPTEPTPTSDPTEPTPDSKWYLFGVVGDDKCQYLNKPAGSAEEGEKFVLDQLEAFGGLAQLGDPPGNVEANREFGRGFARHMVEQLVSPVCMDFITQGGVATPPILLEFIRTVTEGVEMRMVGWGYNLGGLEAAGAAMGPSLVDTIRGV